MKYNILLLFLLLLTARGLRAQTILQQESFETDGSGTRYTQNGYASGTIGGPTATQNNNRYFQRVTETAASATISFNYWPQLPTAGVTGSYFWASEGTTGTVTGPAHDPCYVRLNPVSVAGYTGLQVKVALLDARGPNNVAPTPYYYTSDSLKVQVRLDGGKWRTIGAFYGDNTSAGGTMGYMRQDTDLDGQATDNLSAPALTTTLTDYTFAVDASATTLEARVVVSTGHITTELGFDNIRVLGTKATSQPPVLANLESVSLAYHEGDDYTQLTNTLTVNDPDNTTLSGATVRFTAGFSSTEDQLRYINQNGITGSYNTGTGVLTLTGTATLASYQAALRSVQYKDLNAANASPATRTVTFSATDPSGSTSNLVSRNITVTTALDAASGLPYADDFESDGEGTRYASNTYSVTGGFGFLRTDANPYSPGFGNPTTFSGLSNSFYWFGGNTANPVNPAAVDNGTLTTKQINTAGYGNLQFRLLLGASTATATWHTTEYFKLYYRVAGTGSWMVFGSFRGTSTTTTGAGLLRQDADPSAAPGAAAPTGLALGTALTDVTFALPASLNEQVLEFQLVLVSTDGANDFAFDNLRVTGTALVPPTVTTSAASSITTTSAALGGNVTADGGAAVTERGIVYVVGTGTPTLSNTKVPNGAGTGSFAQTVTGLAAGTTYSVRAYATNKIGTSYGGTISFTTPPNAPVVLAPANGSLLSTRTPTYAGTAQAGSTVTVYVDGTSRGTTTATGGSFSLTPGTALADGPHTVYATATVGSSAASASSLTNNFTVDATAPTVTSFTSSAGASGSSTSTTPFSFSVTFSESVTDFAASGIRVTNGVVSSGPSGSGSGPYTFSATPTTAGTATTVQVLAGAAIDDAGNGSTASATYSLIYVVPVTSTTWTGSVSTDWYTAGNWTAGVPTSTLDATIAGGVARYPTLSSGTATARSLTIAAGASLTQTGGTLAVLGDWLNNGTATLSGGTVSLGGSTAVALGGTAPTTFTNLTIAKTSGAVALGQAVLVNGTLTLSSGTLTTGSYVLTLGNAATLSETDASYVLGRVATTRPLVPGTGENFGGLGLTLTPTLGSVAPGLTPVVRTTGTVLAGIGSSQSILRYFDIQPTVDRNLNVEMTFSYFTHELNGIPVANLVLFKAISTAGPWEGLGRSGQGSTVGGGTVNRTGITDFSIWTLGSSANPLPVELVEFTATRRNLATVALAWTTASELNSAYFEVERSSTGTGFTSLGRVAALGNSSIAHQYTFVDATLPTGAPTLYYRLRQVDQSGDVHYSPVRAVAVTTTSSLVLFPNPAHSKVQLLGGSPGALVQVLNALGQVMATATTDTLGTAALELPLGLTSGVYLVRTGTLVARLVVE